LYLKYKVVSQSAAIRAISIYAIYKNISISSKCN
jgi:hypothetical protein